MKVKILASGSSGNVTLIEFGGELILLDCGKALQWTLQKLDWRLPTAILLTHEHGDHSYSVQSFLKRGVEIYMTAGTKSALKLRGRHNLHEVKIGAEFEVGGLKILAIPSKHDAAEPVNFIVSGGGERLLYATDTGAMPAVEGEFTRILIEANFDEATLLNSDLDEAQKRRILENHLSIEQTMAFLRGRVAAVKLIHISKRHGDGAEFVKRARLATGNERIEV